MGPRVAPGPYFAHLCFNLAMSEKHLFSHCRYEHFAAKIVRLATRQEPSHFEWPVTVMTNAQETSESRWNLPKVPFPSIAFYDTHAKPVHWSSGGGHRLCYKLATYARHPDRYLRNVLTENMPSHTCGNSTMCTDRLHDSEQSLKSTGDPSIHDCFWQNQEIPLMLRDINHLHSL